MVMAIWVQILDKCKGMDPTILPSAMGEIVGQIGLFSLGMANGLGEGKPWIQTC